MAQRVIRVNASRRAVLDIIRRAPHVAVGGSQPAKQLLVRMGLTALSFIKQAFIVKARGGTDAAGLKWLDITPHTKAYSRRNVKLDEAGNVRRNAAGDPAGWIPPGRIRAKYAPSYALTKQQRARWWKLYRQLGGTAPKGKGFHAKGVSQSKAAALAWIHLKAEDGSVKTLMMLYGYRTVPILQDKGLLLNSLSPGVEVAEPPPPVPPPPVEDQIFRLKKGEIIVGTNRKWAGVHHKGGGHVPQRRLWPEPGRWPADWWNQIQEQGRYGLIDIIVAQLGGNP